MTVSRRDRAAVSRLDFTRVWGARDVAAALDIYTEDFRGHGFPFTGTLTREQYMGIVRLFQRAFPDCSITLEEMTTDSEYVYADWTFEGTHTGRVAGIPPSHATVTFSGSGRHRHRNGKVAEVWLDVDWTGLLSQVGYAYPQQVQRAVLG